MTGNNLQTAGPRNLGIPDGLAEPSFHIYFQRDAESGRKDWFFASGQQIFGPFDCFAEADEELSERRAARRFVSSMDG